MDLSQIHRPTLLLDVNKAKRNIQRMSQVASKAGAVFRPHFKTHQSLQIGEWFRAAGVHAITVSSVKMAEYFQAGGWHDITIAFPVNLRELPSLNKLASLGRIGVILDSADVARQLSAGLKHPLHVWIEVDCGQNRSGIHWGNKEAVLQLAGLVSTLPHLNFKGLLSHAGHSYQARSRKEIEAVHAQALQGLVLLKDALFRKGFRDVQLSYGDTPTCSVCTDFAEVDELRPGNFIYYDLMQVQIGACSEEDIAVALACPVAAVYPDRGIAILHGGAVHFSKDSLTGGETHFGHIALPSIGGWTAALPGCHLRSLSQEHGVAAMNKEALALIRPGELLMVLPVHSCLTADLMGGLLGLDGINYGMMP